MTQLTRYTALLYHLYILLDLCCEMSTAGRNFEGSKEEERNDNNETSSKNTTSPPPPPNYSDVVSQLLAYMPPPYTDHQTVAFDAR